MHQELAEKSSKSTVALPPAPAKPSPNDCCGNGCSVCVFDLYELQMRAWEEECAALLADKDDLVSTGEGSVNLQLLSDVKFISFEILSMREIYENTMILLIKVPSFKRWRSCVWHIVARLWSTDGRQLSRSYTPLIPAAASVAEWSSDHVDLLNSDRDHIALLIKLYSDGKFSHLLRQISSGGKIELLGPILSYQYKPNRFRNIVFLAGGTGVLPFIQLIESILANEDDETVIRLLYSSRHYSHLHCHALLHTWTRYWNFSLKYFISQEQPDLDRVSLKWGECVEWGRIDRSHVLQETRVIQSDCDAIFLCGPSEFESCIVGHLTEFKLDSCVIRL